MPRGDGGYSLAEVVVAMAIMSFVALMIVGATTEIYSGTKRIDNTAEARDQLDNSFRRLDRELRYANWVAQPGQVDGSWYMEFATPDGCRQLKLGNGVLSLASWPLGSATRGAPMPLASGVRVISASAPFTRHRAGAQPYASASPGTGMGADYQLVFQQVRLFFNVEAGSVTLPFDSTFTAQNTDLYTAEEHECGGGRV